MKPEEPSPEHRRLQELTHRNLMGLIDSELKLAMTMTELAETEVRVGDDWYARDLLEKVDQAVATVRKYLAHDRVSLEERRAIDGRLAELGKRRQAVKPRASGEPSGT